MKKYTLSTIILGIIVIGILAGSAMNALTGKYLLPNPIRGAVVLWSFMALGMYPLIFFRIHTSNES